MYVNLHTLPAGKSMYTIYVAPKGETIDAGIEFDEIDFVFSKMASAEQIARAAHEENDEDYPDCVIVGIVDQSAGYVVFDGTDSGKGL